jgi:phospholipid/cholesterol/gamma-HCH transport system substrate-binding protein
VSRLRFLSRRDETPVVELQRSNPVRFGIVVLLITAVAVYFGFTKHIPYTHGFRLKAVFNSSLNIATKSPVRIAGVDVGKVSSVERQGETGVVTMEIEKQGLPIHSDATVKIRPRIFLEGNYFVDLLPGSPSAATISSGYTIPLTHTSNPVQIDQVLTALNSDTRANLQTFLAEYGDALTRKPTPAQDAQQDPEVRGLNGAQSIARSFLRGPQALRSSTIVVQALGGTERHDLSGLVRAAEHVTSELNVHEQQLGELIGNFNTFLGSIAAQSTSVTAAVRELPGTLSTTHRALAALDRFLPPLRAFSLDLIPGVEQTPATVQAALPWIQQTRALFGPQELGGVAQGLRNGSPALAGLLGTLPPFFNQVELLNKCLIKVFYPAGEVKLQDGAHTSGIANQQEFFNALVGFTAAAQSFDGNGPFQRLLVTGGPQTVVVPSSTLPLSSAKGFPLAATTAIAPLGTSPRVPTTEPPYKPLVPCYTQALPDVNGPLSQGPADGSAG